MSIILRNITFNIIIINCCRSSIEKYKNRKQIN
uniref:Uncharacterized protein n=1 Tax=CrAss-like virus sp. ctOWe7 TaxID=2826823 RepID=A0A8S5QZE7_9CAUD|nr:MAG TPA: hypothetical protein [CrAss-like virus sp. ctOWe7]